MSPALVRPLATAAALMASPLHAGPVTPLPPVPDRIGFAGAFAGVIGSRLVAGGGANFPDGVMPWDGGKKVWHDRLFELDLSSPSAKWNNIGTLPAPNGYGVSITLPEGILLIGGSDSSRHLAEVTLLTLREGKPAFTPWPLLPQPLAQMAAALVGRRIHLCGGITSPKATAAEAAHLILDLDDRPKGWQAAPALPASGRILASAAAVGDTFYLVGGCSLASDADGKPKRSYLRETWKFSSGIWTRLADLPRPAVAAASPAPVKGHSIYIVSGDDGTQTTPATHKGFTAEILRYDISRNTWSDDGALQVPPPVTLPTAPWKDGFVFFNGEVKPGVRTPAVFLFTPGS
ncbi:galactose oxidase [Luteolibacter sp. GHJ8]|uniref:Galactose oxidase n=1 Tax=Luteolibacter rhizosphaerae TaxID=2989719 RepID=A0ABT3FWV9_9BACT|nr:kelch repeat-containing protein [Luteolibacter rhizosphaerae]MCW1912081.1 galactose oxidase [Luteolibacter rhizosphaerae]